MTMVRIGVAHNTKIVPVLASYPRWTRNAVFRLHMADISNHPTAPFDKDYLASLQKKQTRHVSVLGLTAW
jgi:hypothetical protein